MHFVSLSLCQANFYSRNRFFTSSGDGSIYLWNTKELAQATPALLKCTLSHSGLKGTDHVHPFLSRSPYRPSSLRAHHAQRRIHRGHSHQQAVHLLQHEGGHTGTVFPPLHRSQCSLVRRWIVNVRVFNRTTSKGRFHRWPSFPRIVCSCSARTTAILNCCVESLPAAPNRSCAIRASFFQCLLSRD